MTNNIRIPLLGKAIIMFAVFSFCALNKIVAQDTIVKRNGDKIISKILEVNTSEIKYKRFDYQDGPLFVSFKWDVKYVVYGNGARESFENYSSPKVSQTNQKDLIFEPFGNFKYYYHGRTVTELNMLEIVRKLNDKKLNLLAKKTNEDGVLKTTFKYASIGLAGTSILTLAGIINLKNSAAASTPASRGRGPRGANSAARTAALKQRKVNAGYFVLGSIACALASVSFNLNEIKHAHLTCDLYNRYIVE